MMRKDVFTETHAATAHSLFTLVPSILPQGKRMGDEWVAINPTRTDHSLGSFRINMRSRRWSDFATGDSGGDVISLASYLYGMPPYEAALYIQRLEGVVANDR